jgi:ABC-type transporter Mla MlaB component
MVLIKDNVGIFSLFVKKKDAPTARSTVLTPAVNTLPSNDGDQTKLDSTLLSKDEISNHQVIERRKVARATALKIDAIESEMSSEFVRPFPVAIVNPIKGINPALSLPVKPAPAPAPTPIDRGHQIAHPSDELTTDSIADSIARSIANSIADTIANPTDGLQDNSSELGASIMLPPDIATESVGLFDEIAILYANGQLKIVEQLLTEAIARAANGKADRMVWAMLFDLYQYTNNPSQFEVLSLAYARRFETSPPAWLAGAITESVKKTSPLAKTIPTFTFVGSLDARSALLLENFMLVALTDVPAVKLECSQLTSIDATGCVLLLAPIQLLKKSNANISIGGAQELLTAIRARIDSRVPDELEAAWLLLLEVLNVLQLQEEFDETSIGYCIAFEISPPPYVVPVPRAQPEMEPPPATVETQAFILPGLIVGEIDDLSSQLISFASTHQFMQIDCTALARIDANAADQLLRDLMPLAIEGHIIEFIQVNHLVAALFKVLGFEDIARVVTTKI